jgi:hypothetical protein
VLFLLHSVFFNRAFDSSRALALALALALLQILKKLFDFYELSKEIQSLRTTLKQYSNIIQQGASDTTTDRGQLLSQCHDVFVLDAR